MLLNNFKLLFQFYPDNTFVNVLGETVNKGNILAGQPDTDRYNGHACHASNLLYNYNPNVGSNGYISEQKTYAWKELGAILTFTADTTDLFYLLELAIHLRHLMIINSKMLLNLEF